MRCSRPARLLVVSFVLPFALGLLASRVASPAPPAAAAPSFHNEVMAVLSRAGCNQGVCHGNKNGKGGFKLSLRGQNPEADYRALTREFFSRRINRVEPDQSLILLKATARVPHEGGLRFGEDSQPFDILQRWIAHGAPADGPDRARLVDLQVAPREKVLYHPQREVSISARAEFSDGSSRDVTGLAVFEPSSDLVEARGDGRVQAVRPGEVTVLVRFLDLQRPVRLAFVGERTDFEFRAPPASNTIDEAIFGKLQTLRLQPADDAGDRIFLRRAYLDLLGILPTEEEARSFLEDPAPDKRTKLIDRLLERSEYADHWALKWADLFRIEEKALDRKGVQAFHRWIRDSVARDRPLNEFARDILAARGSTYRQPETNFYRANRNPVMRAEASAQVFLGLRLQCAKCHNHPFDRWTQEDYYGWTALFARVDYRIVENRRRDRNDKHEFNGEQIVYMAPRGEVTDPRTGKAAPPRFLGDDTNPLSPDADRLRALGDWVADPENPFFARAQVNRIWYHLMGRGLVDPIDDFRATNPASHPRLLEKLTASFREGGFRVKPIIRQIMRSRAYQLSGVPHETVRDDSMNYAFVPARRLPAETILDTLAQVTGVSPRFTGYPVGVRATQIPGIHAVRPRDRRPSTADHFLKLFGKPPRLLACECERSDETTLSQAFQLVSGPLLHELLTSEGGRIRELAESDQPFDQAVARLYWAALTREPSDAELEAARKLRSAAASRREALEDLAWSLVNAKEFLLRL